MIPLLVALSIIPYNGSFEQGGLAEFEAPAGTRMWFNGEEIERKPNGKFYVGFIRNSAPINSLKVQFPSGKEIEYQLPIAQRQFHSSRLKTAMNYPSSGKTAKDETLDISWVRRTAGDECPANLEFAAPSNRPVVGRFGTERYYNGRSAPYHSGVDFAGPTGDPVYAPGAGTIKLAEFTRLTGNTMVIDHGCGITSTLAHLSAFDKHVGDRVEIGELVGRIGRTGLATGPHLHWNMNLGRVRLDPQLVLHKDNYQSESLTDYAGESPNAPLGGP